MKSRIVGKQPYPRLRTLDRKTLEALALDKFIEQIGGEYVDVPEMTDCSGTAVYTRFSLRYFLEKLLGDKANETEATKA